MKSRIKKEDIDKNDLEYLVNERCLPNTEISHILNCSVEFIRTCVKHYDIDVPSISERIKSQYKNGRKVNCKIYDIPPKEDIEFLYNEKKMSLNKMKDVFSTSIPTLKKWMKEYNITQRTLEDNKKINVFSNKYIPDDIRECLENEQWMIDAYSLLSMSNIAKMLGVTVSMIHSWIHKHGIKVNVLNKPLTNNEFIEKAIEKHGDKYIYDITEYSIAHNKIEIICPDHGTFNQKASDHYINGAGCPKCGNNLSKNEDEIKDYIKSISDTKIIQRDRNIIYPLELDIYLPELNIAIEYNGLYWHSEQNQRIYRNYHKDKTELCLKNNIRLIHIWEDDWVYHKERIKMWLSSILGLTENIKVFGRKTVIKYHDPVDLKSFFDDYHIQGFTNSTFAYGLYYKEKLVSACLFKKNGSKLYLTRYVTRYGYHVIGGFPKLMSAVKYDYDIYTFADLSWVSPIENVYTRNGFVVDGYLQPDYKYIVNNKRCHKFGFRHKQLSNKLLNYDSNLTEYQNCLNNNIYRIWDCGKIRYLLHMS